MKKILLYVGLFSLLLFVTIIILDLVNVSTIIPLTNKYDWLSFVGTYFAGVGTIFLGIVSIKQNQKLSSLNKKMLSNDMVSNCFSQIELVGNFYVEDCKEELIDCYGLKMKNIENSESKNYHRIIFRLKDINNLPLKCAEIKKLTIQYQINGEFGDKVNIDSVYYPSDKALPVTLEVAPNSSEITYYLPIAIIDDIKILKNIISSVNLRIIADMSITNSFGVTSNGEYTFRITKTNNRANNGLWIEYKLGARKIYYKEINYYDI